MVNGVGFMISEEEDLTLGPGSWVDPSRLLCSRVVFKWKGTEKASDTDIRREQRVPPH